jgi:WD40 repeat protein
MQIRNDARHPVARPACVLAVAMTMLAGCAPSASERTVSLNPVNGVGANLRQMLEAVNGRSSSPSARRSRLRVDLTPPELYVSDAENGFVDVYSLKTRSLVGQIAANHPTGLATDLRNNLYVANLGGGNVTVYALGQTEPSLTLTDPGARPDAVAVGTDGTVYVADENGVVYLYPMGTTQSTSSLSNAAVESANAVAVDAANDVYVAGYNHVGNGEVVEYAQARGSGVNLQLRGLEGPAGIALDRRRRIVLADLLMPGISVFKHNATTAYRVFAQSGNPNRFAFNRTKSRVYVPMTSSDVNIYDYKSGALIGTLIGPSGSVMIGAAMIPAPQN